VAPHNQERGLMDWSEFIQREAEQAEDEAVSFAADDQTTRSRANGHDKSGLIIRATPFEWIDPIMLPRRQWLYGRHLIRGFLSTTIAPGGYGKSSLIVGEALAMVTGHVLLGDQPAGQLRLWQINLEDPEDELQRRFIAAAIHYKIDPVEIGDRLFVDSGRKLNFVIAREGRDGVKIAVPILEAIEAEIIDKKIDVLQIDPFVACHSVSENDNTKIATVARQWAMIAEATGCAIELVHHARKGTGPGQGFTVDDARGASALIAAVRSARVLNGMTKEEAEKAGVEDRAAYFNVTNGKSNLAPRSNKAIWRHIIGVPLRNGTSPFDPLGDYVGVVEPWSWPDPFAEVSLEEAKEVQQRIVSGEWREDHRSKTWAGIAIAEVLGLDVSDKDARTKIRALLRGWLSTGALRVAEHKDNKRREKKFIEVGRWLS